ncbi:MAG: hypothetical protein M3N53_06680 [Actinomycetota bacterium]|nr:hypothetical protein [Actinomycetota bacterium]
MRQRLCVLLAACALVGGCTTRGASVTTGGPSATRHEFEAPPKVSPQRVKLSLDPEKIERCMPKERVEIASLAGQYFGPIDFVMDQVETVRELDFTAPSDIQMVDRTEFSRLAKQTQTKLEAKDRAINDWLQWSLGFRLLGTDGSTNPKGDSADLVAGFYVPAEDKIVLAEEGKLDSEYVILAHELGHAAVDQVFGLPHSKSPRLVDDESLAMSSLIEGDATLAELQVSARFANKRAIDKTLERLLTNDKTYNLEREAGTPHAIIERFIFPYRWGLSFVCSVYLKQGWDGVDRAYSRPPTSSAEIMFPDRYLAKVRPERPPGFPKLPKPWKLYAEGTIGAMHLKAMFEAPADREALALSNPLGRAAAWAGGRYVVWGQRPENITSVFAMSLMEHRQHRGVLCSSLMEWHEQAYNYAEQEVIADGAVAYSDPTRTTVVTCRGRNVRLAMAPSRPLAETLARL